MNPTCYAVTAPYATRKAVRQNPQREHPQFEKATAHHASPAQVAKVPRGLNAAPVTGPNMVVIEVEIAVATVAALAIAVLISTPILNWKN